MNVTREVILDLLPLYQAGEASPATRALVEEYLAQDPELREHALRTPEADIPHGAREEPRAETELLSIHRTRGLLALQRWVFGLALGLTAIALSMEFNISGGRVSLFRFLIWRYPIQLGACALAAMALWAGYSLLRGRLRITR